MTVSNDYRPEEQRFENADDTSDRTGVIHHHLLNNHALPTRSGIDVDTIVTSIFDRILDTSDSHFQLIRLRAATSAFQG